MSIVHAHACPGACRGLGLTPYPLRGFPFPTSPTARPLRPVPNGNPLAPEGDPHSIRTASAPSFRIRGLRMHASSICNLTCMQVNLFRRGQPRAMAAQSGRATVAPTAAELAVAAARPAATAAIASRLRTTRHGLPAPPEQVRSSAHRVRVCRWPGCLSKWPWPSSSRAAHVHTMPAVGCKLADSCASPCVLAVCLLVAA